MRREAMMSLRESAPRNRELTPAGPRRTLAAAYTLAPDIVSPAACVRRVRVDRFVTIHSSRFKSI